MRVYDKEYRLEHYFKAEIARKSKAKMGSAQNKYDLLRQLQKYV